MNEEKARALVFSRRAAFLGGVQLLMLGTLAGRMYQLQVVESDKYLLQSEENQFSLRLLVPPRGRILDRFGVPLAENDNNYRIVVVPEKSGDLEQVLTKLSRFVALEPEDFERVRKESKKSRPFWSIIVAENLSWQQMASIEVNAPDLPGVEIEVAQRRRYTFGRSVAHVLGYVGSVDEKELTGDPLLSQPGFRIGKTGIERQYESGPPSAAP